MPAKAMKMKPAGAAAPSAKWSAKKSKKSDNAAFFAEPELEDVDDEVDEDYNMEEQEEEVLDDQEQEEP